MAIMKKSFLLNSLLALSCVSTSAFAASSTWDATTAGPNSWNLATPTNWDPDITFPNGVDELATFPDLTLTGPQDVDVNTPITIGSILFTNTAAGSSPYTITGTSINNLTFDSTGTALISNSSTGDNTISAPIKLSKPLTITLDGSGPLTLSGGISESTLNTNLILNGTAGATLTISGANSCTGTTTIENGTLDYAISAAINKDSPVTIGDGLGAAGSASLNIGAAISNADAFAVSDIKSDGKLEQNAEVFLKSLSGSAGEIVFDGTHLFEIKGGTTTVSSIISGGAAGTDNEQTGSLFRITGGDTLTLDGANTYTSRTFLAGNSTLIIGGNSALGASGADHEAYAEAGSTFKLTSTGMTIDKDFKLNGEILNSGNVNNTISGAITLGFTSTTPAITATAGTFTVHNASAALTLSGKISGIGGLTKMGPGTLKLRGTEANEYSGETLIKEGVLNYDAASAIPSDSPISVIGSLTTPAELNITAHMEALPDNSFITLTDLAIHGTISQNGPTSAVRIDKLTGLGTVKLNSGGSGNNPFEIMGSVASIFHGVIQGGALSTNPAPFAAQAFIVSNSSNLTLTRLNTYLSPTFVTGGGTVILQNPKALGKNPSEGGSSAYAYSGGTFQIDSGAALVSTPFFLNGDGALGVGALTNINDVNILSGPITIGWDAPLAHPPIVATDVKISVTTNNPTSSLELSGVLSGPKGVSKIGNGTLTFSGGADNTYSGLTKVENGTLEMVKTANKNAIPGDLTITGGTLRNREANQIADACKMTINGGTYDMNGFSESFSSLTFTSGSLLQPTASSLSLSGTATVLSMTGGTDIPGNLFITSSATNGNIKFVANGATSSSIGAIHLGASPRTIEVESGAGLFDLTIGGTVNPSSPNGFTKTGPGILQLTGTHVYGSESLITGGALSVNGTYGGNISVDTGATLQGIGAITGDVKILTGGSFAPGNSIATTTVNGDLTFGPSSTLTVEVDQTLSSPTDKLIVNGTLHVDPAASIVIQPITPLQAGDFTYVIVSVPGSGGITGPFVPTLPPPALLLNYRLDQFPNAIHLTTHVNPFTAVMGQGNGGALAAYWGCITPVAGSPLTNFITDLRAHATLPQLNEAAEETSGSPLKAFAAADESNIIQMRSKITNRTKGAAQRTCRADISREQTKRAWADIGADIARQNSRPAETDKKTGYTTLSENAMIGFDYEGSESFLYGAGLGFTHTSLKLLEERGKGEINSGYAALYAHSYSPHLFMDLGLVGGFSRHSEERNIEFTVGTGIASTNYHQKAHGAFNGLELLTHIGFGLVQTWKNFEFSPFGMVDYLLSNHNNFTEKDAGIFNLDVDSSDYSMVRGEAGLNFSWCTVTEKSRSSIKGKLGLIREERLTGETLKSRYIGTAPCSFTVEGLRESRTLFSPGLGLSMNSLDEELTFNIRYQGEYGRHYHNTAFAIELLTRF